ncbi:MAG TPA: zinc-dependent alcohol dehydrogenase family protein [Acidobacteriaceae bacterium]|nr:zinc-dependent alcohol dehydrogenase family protein [Acidobacteriaceae bacterium]
MPKTVRFHQLGGPENLRFEDLPAREPQHGEVKLRVKAVGLNRAESLYFRGLYLEKPELPSRLGYEAEGIVMAVGPDVTRAWIGKRVSTIPGFSQNQYGVLAEEAIVPVSSLGEFPEKFSPVEGAAIWMQYTTAWGALLHVGKLTRADYVIISAASSSVGLAAIQIVKDTGATAIATTRSSIKRDELLALGADHVIATGEEDLVARVNQITFGQGARLIFDPIAGAFVSELARAASYHGIIIEYGALSLESTHFPFFYALRKGLTMRAYTLREITADPNALAAAKEYIYNRLSDGRFAPKIARTFPFAQAAEAYRYLESNAQVGKVVITVP